MRKKSLLIIGITIIIIIAILTTIKETNKGKYSYLTVGNARLMVENARTPAETEKGLSGRKSLCQDCGLLFFFPRKQHYAFWMKQMYFDIDIMWIDGDKIVDISYGAKKPNQIGFNNPKETYSPKVPVDRVLEVNVGWVVRNKVVIGDLISLEKPLK